MATRHPWLSLIPVCEQDPEDGAGWDGVHEAVERHGPGPT
jgi:hypothetical protein